jgi:hypothetical protein
MASRRINDGYESCDTQRLLHSDHRLHFHVNIECLVVSGGIKEYIGEAMDRQPRTQEVGKKVISDRISEHMSSSSNLEFQARSIVEALTRDLREYSYISGVGRMSQTFFPSIQLDLSCYTAACDYPVLRCSEVIASTGSSSSKIRESILEVDRMIDSANKVFATTHHKQIKWQWRQLHTDASLLSVVGNIILCSFQDAKTLDAMKEEEFWTHLIVKLDLAMIVSGAPGNERREWIYTLVEIIQAQLPTAQPRSEYKFAVEPNNTSSGETSGLLTAANSIPSLSSPPSLGQFLSTYMHTPFIVKGFASNWPAITKWNSLSYLQKAGGRGRVVPVEVGSNYTSVDWSQQFISWEEFLERLVSSESSCNESQEGAPRQPNYLAQHSLLEQFPSLREDIIIPDYVYASPDAPSYFQEYTPPSNQDQLVVNAWIGPKGTLSPPHTVRSYNLLFGCHSSTCFQDPYFNCFGNLVIHMSNDKF